MSYITIAMDAMGGDYGPSEIVPAVAYMLKAHADLRLILVGNDSVQAELRKHKLELSERLQFKFASETVAMDEAPATALRNKKDSSMRVMMDIVKAGEAQACVSCGNTGALMATGRYVFKMIEGVERPAIISRMPTHDSHKFVRMLDMGANVDSTVEHLLQFAVMGSVMASAVDGQANPRVGLLSNGKEDIKGNDLVKETSKRLQVMPGLNYIGYVEADDMFHGEVDVVVCDGFVGNLTLKSVEGITKLLLQLLRQEFTRSWYNRLAALLAKPVLKALMKRIDPSRFNGATLIGLQGIVVKSHGGAKRMAIANAIKEAMQEAKKEVPLKIQSQVMQLLQQAQGSA